MIVEGTLPGPDELLHRAGWELRPEGACRGDVCVPLPAGARGDIGRIAEALGMPLIQDAATGTWCLGPGASGRELAAALAPDLVLPDHRGNAFALSSLLGQKVLLVAWASW
jgi:hypothetical protein